MLNPPKISLRVVLIAINLFVLILPVAGIGLMRLYESALVRQTESALIAQAAFVAAFYRSQILNVGTQSWESMSRDVQAPNPVWQDGDWVPRPPTLDLATSPKLSPFPDGVGKGNANPFASAVGEKLIPVLKDAQLTTLAGIRIVDPWGVIVASTGDDVGQSIAHAEEISLALQGHSASRIRTKTDIVEPSAISNISRTSSIRVFVATPILLHDRLVGAVMLSRTPPSIVQALEAKRWLLLQVLLLLIALVVVMSLLTFRLIARPIARLADQAGQIARGEMSAAQTLTSPESRKPRTREIARLQDAITEMASTLEQRANYLQEFSRHVSHEFKTPIASIRGAIEVLEDHDMSDEQRDRFLANIAADAERLQRLTTRLTELTQAEMSSGAGGSCSVRDVVTQLSQQFELETTNINSQAQLPIQYDALVAVLETLVENAQQHGATQISISMPDAKSLHIEDNGKGISQNNAAEIFTPFFTTKREHGGTGLGLTIASALLKQFDAELELVSAQDPTCFSIKFSH